MTNICLFLGLGNSGATKRRGITNGTTVINLCHQLGGKIQVPHQLESCEVEDKRLSLLIHEIGSAVRDKVPMIASSFVKLDNASQMVVFNHLSVSFVWLTY